MATQGETKRVQVFKYERPNLTRGKGVVRLCNSDILNAHVQVLKEGGENNLHSHSATDQFYVVLAGRIRFYGEGDVVLAELGRHEGIFVPRGFKYWFESASDEPLEVLRGAATVAGEGSRRTDFTPQKEVTLAHDTFTAARPSGAGPDALSPAPAAPYRGRE